MPMNAPSATATPDSIGGARRWPVMAPIAAALPVSLLGAEIKPLIKLTAAAAPDRFAGPGVDSVPVRVLVTAAEPDIDAGTLTSPLIAP